LILQDNQSNENLTLAALLKGYKKNNVKSKVVYRFSTGQRTKVLTELDWHAEKNNEVTILVVELSDLINERLAAGWNVHSGKEKYI
tara:strand:+ start:1435 stop:1692 length:258 start_codon:yes stop_codon:yes gene_type:complete